MRIGLSNSKRPVLSGGLLLSALLPLGVLGTTGPAVAGCGISSYQNYGGAHSATASSGVHTATSNPPAGSIGTPSLSSCPTTNATFHPAGASAPAGHGVVTHVPSGMTHVKQAATSNGRPNANKPSVGTATAVRAANLKSVRR